MKKNRNRKKEKIQMLEKVADLLACVKQWLRCKDNLDWLQNACKYLAQAEIIVELLEVEECGSVGGYDEGQPPTNSLFERWVWIYQKYDNNLASKKFGICRIPFQDLKDFFDPE